MSLWEGRVFACVCEADGDVCRSVPCEEEQVFWLLWLLVNAAVASNAL